MAVGRGLDVEDLAGLVECHARGERGAAAGRVAHLDLVALVVGGSLGLLVRGDKGPAEDSGACQEGGDDELVRLVKSEHGVFGGSAAGMGGNGSREIALESMGGCRHTIVTDKQNRRN